MLTKKDFENIIAGDTYGSKAVLMKGEQVRALQLLVCYQKAIGGYTGKNDFHINLSKDYGVMWVTNDEYFEYLGTERYVGADAMMMMTNATTAMFGVKGDFGITFVFEIVD